MSPWCLSRLGELWPFPTTDPWKTGYSSQVPAKSPRAVTSLQEDAAALVRSDEREICQMVKPYRYDHYLGLNIKICCSCSCATGLHVLLQGDILNTFTFSPFQFPT